MRRGLVAGTPATGTVTHAHRLPGAIVNFLFDATEVTLSTRLETYRLATTFNAAWYLASSDVMGKVLTDVMNARLHLLAPYAASPLVTGAARYRRRLQRRSTLATATKLFDLDREKVLICQRGEQLVVASVPGQLVFPTT